MPDGQVKYWSVATMASAPSGELWDGLSDMMLPLDEQGYYTIVVSRPEDRPKNATRENGVAWMDWGPGEGLDDPRDRKDWGMLLMRFMVCHPAWETSPAKAHKPGTEADVMGPYYPRGYYTTKAEFEAEGVRKPSFLQDFTIENTRGLRYAELAIVGEKAVTIYNSTGLSEAPPDQWNALDAQPIKEQPSASENNSRLEACDSDGPPHYLPLWPEMEKWRHFSTRSSRRTSVAPSCTPRASWPTSWARQRVMPTSCNPRISRWMITWPSSETG